MKQQFKDFVEAWFDYYESQTGLKYRFTDKDGNHLKQLIKYFNNDCQKFKELLQSISDPWILEHLEVPIINSRLNSLMQQMVKPKRKDPDKVYKPLPERTEGYISPPVDYEALKRRLGIIKDIEA